MNKMPSDDAPEEAAKNAGVAALDRAFMILSAFRAGEDSVTLAEIARRTGFYKSTILRLLVSLENGQFVRRLADGRYSVGAEPLRLAQIYQDSFKDREVMESILQQLCDESGETASFFIRQRDCRVVLYRVEPNRAIRYTIREGERFPVEVGASGKILMAFAKPYKKNFDEIRERMWYVSYGERDAELSSAAVPVLMKDLELHGAISLSGPRDRFVRPGHVHEVCKLLMAAGQSATRAMGGDASLFARSIDQLARGPFPEAQS